MPTLEELEAADRKQAEAIAKLEAHVADHDGRLDRHDRHLFKLDESIGMLRENFGRVATKDDILNLSRNIDDKYTTHMRDAQNSLPGRMGIVLAAGTLICTIITVVIALTHR
jgi:uncharacterized coiled-coil protein SlyX